MTQSSIVIIVILGSLVLFTLLYINHVMDKQKRQKAILASQLKESTYNLQSLLDAIPDGAIDTDTKLLLLEKLKNTVNRLISVTGKEQEFRSNVQWVEEMLSQCASKPALPPAPTIRSAQEAEKLKGILKRVSNLIESMARRNEIAVPVARAQLTAIQQRFGLGFGRFLLQESIQMDANEHPQAISFCDNAIKQLEALAASPQRDATLEEAREKRQQLESKLNHHSSKIDESPETELAKGTEKLNEDDSWKKKYF